MLEEEERRRRLGRRRRPPRRRAAAVVSRRRAAGTLGGPSTSRVSARRTPGCGPRPRRRRPSRWRRCRRSARSLHQFSYPYFAPPVLHLPRAVQRPGHDAVQPQLLPRVHHASHCHQSASDDPSSAPCPICRAVVRLRDLQPPGRIIPEGPHAAAAHGRAPPAAAPPPTVRAQPPASSRTDHATPPQPTGARPQSEGECSICLEPYSDRVTTPCNHSFCRECITRVIALDQSASERGAVPVLPGGRATRDLQPSAAAAHGRPLERPRAHHERRAAALDAAANRFINMRRQAMWGTADVVDRVHRRHVDRASEARDRDARRRQREEAARYREAAAARAPRRLPWTLDVDRRP